MITITTITIYYWAYCYILSCIIHNVLSKWLRSDEREDGKFSKFLINAVKEQTKPNEDIRKYLAAIYQDNLIDPSLYKELIERLESSFVGFNQETGDPILGKKLPKEKVVTFLQILNDGLKKLEDDYIK